MLLVALTRSCFPLCPYIFLSIFSSTLSSVCLMAVIVVSSLFSSPVPSLSSCRHVSNAAGLRWSCMPVSRGGTPHFLWLCCLTLYCLCSSNVLLSYIGDDFGWSVMFKYTYFSIVKLFVISKHSHFLRPVKKRK